MSRRRRAPLRPAAAAVVAVVLSAVLVVALLARLLTGAFGLLKSGGASAPDPQFAEAPETITRPPETNEAGAAPDWGEDPSLNWVYEAQTPVDKTAEELSREAATAP